jgi:NAD(P)-dependent dehydrogenase (short-subunit alcohol dehydrogenase family)
VSAATPRQVAIVTGAAGAIGKATVRALSRHYAVVSTDVARARPAGEAELSLAMDVTREVEVRAVRAQVLSQLGRVDLLVYCAGVVGRGSVLAARIAVWQQTFEVNVLGAARCVRAFGELMARQRSGRIILLGSVAARLGLPGAAAYCASKAALESLARSAALELAPHGVAVIALSPGWVDTPFAAGAEAGAGKSVPLGRAASAREVAEVVTTLAILKTNYLTGASIPLDGGLSSY